MILFNPTSSYLLLNFLSCQGTETKKSISYTNFLSPHKKENETKKREKKIKKGSWTRLCGAVWLGSCEYGFSCVRSVPLSAQ